MFLTIRNESETMAKGNPDDQLAPF